MSLERTAYAPKRFVEGIYLKLDLAIKVISVYAVIFIQMLDVSIANLALIHISKDLNIDTYQSVWVITAFGLGLSISFPLSSLLSKILQTNRLYFISLVLFTLASLVCGTTDNLSAFLAGRFMQGLNSGIAVVLSQSILFMLLGEHRRSFAVSLWTSAIAVAPVVGPVIGAFMTDYYGWHSLFLINAPLILVCIVGLSDFLLKKDHEPISEDLKRTPYKPFLLLAILSVGLVALQYGLDFGDKYHWFESYAISASFVVFVVVFFIFMIMNKREEYQLFDFSVFKDSKFRSSVIMISLVNGITFLSMIVLPIWLQSVYGLSMMDAAYLLAGSGIVTAIASPFIGMINNQRVYHYVVLFGILVVILSCWYSSILGEQSSYAEWFFSRMLMGAGLALFGPMSYLAIANLTEDKIVNANAIALFMRMVLANVILAISFSYVRTSNVAVYEDFISKMDRMSMFERGAQIMSQVGSFDMMSYVSKLTQTHVLQSVFLMSALGLLIPFLLLSKMETISRFLTKTLWPQKKETIRCP